jgi:hypothetical protein
MKSKTLIRNLLLAFVLVSIGFALGKESALRKTGSTAPSATQPGDDKLVVYYLRATFRCVTCNAVEEQTNELLRAEHAEELADGRMEYRVADFLEDRELASRYDVSGNLVVIARLEDGEEVKTVRLDQVMDLATDADAFADYLRNGIAEAKSGAGT